MSKEIAKKQDTEIAAYDLFDDGSQGTEKVSELPVIKVLHAAGLFQLPDGSTTNKIEGIILHYHRHNAWWSKSLEDSDTPSCPDCFAIELVKGESMKPHPKCLMPQVKYKKGTLVPAVGLPQDEHIFGSDEPQQPAYYKGACDGTCDECDLNKWGSKGKGKACSSKIALFLLIPGYFVPLRLEVSTMSLKNCSKYLDSFTITGELIDEKNGVKRYKRKYYQTFATTITAEVETRGANTFSILNFACGAQETDFEKLKGIKNIIDDYMDLFLKVPEPIDELAE